LNVLLTNYRYFVSGGPERYLFNLKRLLEERRHKVVPFSVSHPRNEETEYSRYFLSPLTDDPEAVTLRQMRLTPATVAKLADRTFFSIEALARIRKLLDEVPVDVSYTMHFLRWISPTILYELSARGIPTVVRVSDFEYMCPGTHLLRDGEICELCVGDGLWPSVKYKCVQGSTLLSLAHFVAMSLYRVAGALRKIDAFVCPSRFTLGRMQKAGFPTDRLFHVPTFVDRRSVTPEFSPGEYILYAGRVSREKGVAVLLDAYAKLRAAGGDSALPLHIAHTGGEEAAALERRAARGELPGVVLVSGLSGREYYSHVRRSAFTVVPSLCYDNLPNAILESYACGKPVVGSRRGSIPETVREGETGYLFEPGDSDDLAEKMAAAARSPRRRVEMGRAARTLVEREYNEDIHYETLMGLFSRLRG